MARKRVQALADDRGMDPADVLAELQQSGHKVTATSHTVEEYDAVRALDVGVRRLDYHRDGEHIGTAFVKSDSDLTAHIRGIELGLQPDDTTHVTVTVVGLPGEGRLEDVAPRDVRHKLLAPAEVHELVQTQPARTKARERAGLPLERELPDQRGALDG